MPLPLVTGLGSGFLAFFARAFIFSVIIDFIIKSLVGLGLIYVAYNMGDWSLNALFNLARNNAAQMPVDVLTLLVKMGLNDVMRILFSAFAVRVALTMMQNTKVLRMLSFS